MSIQNLERIEGGQSPIPWHLVLVTQAVSQFRQEMREWDVPVFAQIHTLFLEYGQAKHSLNIELEYSVTRLPILMESLVLARATAAFSNKLENLRKFDLLILDDWGIEPFSKRAQNDLLELIESQVGKRSVLFTSQMPLNVWHDAFDNETVADALMDRVIHGSYHIQLSGESLRKARNPNAKLTRSAAK